MQPGTERPPGRRPMTGNTDPRAVRTREKLVSAFHDAVVDSQPSEMSVSALARAAGINRTSFYTHFDSPEDLAIHALGELFDAVGQADIARRIGQEIEPGQSTRHALGEIVYFVDGRRTSYRRLLGPGAAPRLATAVTDAFTARIIPGLARLPDRPTGLDITVLAQFLAGGVLGVLGRWLTEEDPPRSADDVIESLVRCFPAWLNSS